jgi:hypothetical protein
MGATPDEPVVGQVVSHYRIVEKLGGGRARRAFFLGSNSKPYTQCRRFRMRHARVADAMR